MFERLVPVSRDRHAGKRVLPLERFGFARGFHVASLMMHEFVRATPFYPIVFIDDRERETFRPVVLLGLEANENLYVDPVSLAWLPGAYIPGILRRYPFALANTSVSGEFALCVDEASPLLSESQGLPLFMPDGAPGEALENIKRYLSELQQMETLTGEFCAFLVRHNLLRPLNLRVRAGEGMRDIGGSYVVNEERFDALSDDLILEMRRQRHLQAVYAHLSSLPQLDRLVRLKEGRVNKGELESAQTPAQAASTVSARGTTVGVETSVSGSSEAPPALAPKPAARRRTPKKSA